ncbi:MFS transporter [Chitinophaga sancti]|uniref:MFS transporter n=1 Tax=Chitinophaga sancti TaxID=1004 RepID=A0A1K1QZ04_9BACT|nr:MFS transporter [Chitinophaga sancti]WQD62082.1 MFS transporter [Chitinophaga sancti]WQG92349.1 MFS transporter [Chitinophaga sancti]SFW64897.1 MFS transporter, NNP family, nitrate/nitrite transporter [Chitinophaga sancti]
MNSTSLSKAHRILFFNTLGFLVSFAGWMVNGVLVTYLVDNGIFNWNLVDVGWLLGIPVLTGSIMRLPVGMLTDVVGGKWMFTILLLGCSIPMFLLSQANSYSAFLVLSFFFGLLGTSFSIGVGFVSVWYPKSWQGRALGLFGFGLTGSAVTTLFAPTLLKKLTDNGANPEGWRHLPIIYAVVLAVVGILFFLFTTNKKPEASDKTLIKLLQPLKNVRVWRFGLYYFLVFGCFVAFSQWLLPYFVNAYNVSLITAGFLASCFSLPVGVFRAVGGWLSDKYGARRIMYWVLCSSVVLSFLLIIPRMQIYSPGTGIMAVKAGTVTQVNDSLILVDNKAYPIVMRSHKFDHVDRKVMILPAKDVWQEPVVKVGDQVTKKQLLAQGTTMIFFKANMWVYVVIIILIGACWGIGTAAVFKHIPEYFPNEIGAVGGMVGMIGGLGGFVGPILFGYLLNVTGLWTSSWMFVCLLSCACLMWMHRVITTMMKKGAPELADKFEKIPG